MLYPQKPLPPVWLASSWARVGPLVPSVPVPLVASGQLRVTDPPAPTVTLLGREGSDSALAVTELTAWGCHTTQPRNSWLQVWVIQLKSALSASRALTRPWSLGAVVSTTCPGSV